MWTDVNVSGLTWSVLLSEKLCVLKKITTTTCSSLSAIAMRIRYIALLSIFVEDSWVDCHPLESHLLTSVVREVRLTPRRRVAAHSARPIHFQPSFAWFLRCVVLFFCRRSAWIVFNTSRLGVLERWRSQTWGAIRRPHKGIKGSTICNINGVIMQMRYQLSSLRTVIFTARRHGAHWWDVSSS